MGLLIIPDDFVGTYGVAQTSSTTLSSYIDRYEEYYLIQLLGLDLFNLFKASVSSHVPAPGVYKTIFDPIRVQNNGFVAMNNGMKNMMLGFIQGIFVSEQPAKSTPSGVSTNRVDVADRINFFGTPACRNYNQSVEDAKVIQYYIKQNETDYPDYAGQKIKPWHWSLE